MSRVAYTSSPKSVRGREIAWLGGKMFAEITVDGFGRGGWVHFFRPRHGIANPLWARSRTHAHQIIEMQAEQPSPLSGDTDSRVSTSPANSAVNPRSARNPQAGTR